MRSQIFRSISVVVVSILSACSSACVYLQARDSGQIPYKATIIDNADIGKISFHPSNKSIIFSLSRRNESKIMLLNIDGSNPSFIDTGLKYNYDPVFSADGETILFASSSDVNGLDICLLDLKSYEKHCFSSENLHDYNPIFSPDGKKIYFLRSTWFGNYSPVGRPAWHGTDIYSINIDGTSLKRITWGNYYGMADLSIHPDGKTFLARLWIYGEPSIRKYTLDGIYIEQEPICPKLNGSSKEINCDRLYSPQLSPDGRFIIFTWERNKFFGSRYRQMYIMDQNINEAQKMTRMDRDVLKPAFSLDGTLIVFNTWRLQKGMVQNALWILNYDGSDLHTINIKE